MELPGGVPGAGEIRKDYAFKGINGELELALAESDFRLPTSALVTRTLVQALDQLAGEKPEYAQVARLCVGDRQYLMRQLAIELGHDRQWLNADCHACGETFDFQIQLSQLPVKTASEGYPLIEVEVETGRLSIRLPNGEDQTAIAHITDGNEAQLCLLQRCIVLLNDMDVDEEVKASIVSTLSAAELEKIDAAMEAIAPEPTTRLSAACPACGKENTIGLDPYSVLNKSSADIFTEVHTLAWHYHWSEAEILSMPRKRRVRYLAYIDQSRGFNSREVADVNGAAY